MTATLYPSQRADRITPRSIGGASTGYPAHTRRSSYGVRRAVAALLGMVLVAGIAVAGAEVLGALADVGARPAVASVGAASDAPAVRIHVAQPGDTLWSIADRYRGDVGHGRFVDALIDLNSGASIQVGQAVRLP